VVAQEPTNLVTIHLADLVQAVLAPMAVAAVTAEPQVELELHLLPQVILYMQVMQVPLDIV
jgi:hypothetical protein